MGIGVGVSVGAIMILVNFACLSLRKREPTISIRGENREMHPPHVQAQLPAELNSHFTYEMPTNPRQLAEDLHGNTENRTQGSRLFV
ncbi:hypothetical protein BDV41DRAFT_552086 [Aspergillus transmontanensis]|uniref:Uncharacterized protein n=1 Tax=Aspergillus transmontanensis TaxID=1034304 RepID=A0A5N6VI82_9EURO|nr:hypothetical protein BDV41DRAFT_552086 [Aspergillus transmontanensis]